MTFLEGTMKKKDIITLEIQDVNFPNKAYGDFKGERNEFKR